MTMRRSEFPSDHSASTGNRFPASASSSSAAAPDGSAIPVTTEVRNTDILSGRGKSYAKHPGNLRFDDIIKQNLQRYFSVTTHTDKKMITEEIVDEVTSLGRFLRYDKEIKKWIMMDREAARIKVAQALQYRQRRVSKGLESMDDSLEPRPLPSSATAEQSQRQQAMNFLPLPQAAVSSQDQDSIHIGSASQHLSMDGGSSQHCGWNADLQRQPHMAHSSHSAIGGTRAFDFEDTSIGVAAAQIQQQQQRDQQTLSRHIESLLSQRLLNQSHALSDAARQHQQPNLPFDPSSTFHPAMGTFGQLHRQTSLHGATPLTSSSQHQQQLDQGMVSLASLEPRPLPFADTEATFTGVPSRLAGGQRVPAQARDETLDPASSSYQHISHGQRHHRPLDQHRHDDLDDASLSNLYTAAVDDDPTLEETETDPVSSWDDPAFDAGH